MLARVVNSWYKEIQHSNRKLKCSVLCSLANSHCCLFNSVNNDFYYLGLLILTFYPFFPLMRDFFVSNDVWMQLSHVNLRYA